MPELRTIGFVSYTGQLVLVVKNPPANAGDVRDAGSIPGLRRSLEERMATYPSTLAWRIPRTEEPGGLQTIGSQRVGHDCSDLTHTQDSYNSQERSLFPNSDRGSLCSYTSVALSSGGCSGSKLELVICILEHQSTWLG